jgi:hypothetical protein
MVNPRAKRVWPGREAHAVAGFVEDLEKIALTVVPGVMIYLLGG